MSKSAFYELRHEDGTVTRHRRDNARRVTNATARHIRERVAEGAKFSEVARETGVNHATVQRIAEGRYYLDAGGPIIKQRCSKCGRTKNCAEFDSNSQCRKCRNGDGSKWCDTCSGLADRRQKPACPECGELYRARTDPSMRAVRGIQSNAQRWERLG